MGKHNEIKRDKRISIPVTQEEKERIQSAASRTIYKSAATMCREVILGILPSIEERDWDNEIEFVVENKGILMED